jgi:F-type H+-transporting ATPase subunit b
VSAQRSRLTAKFMDQALLDALGNFFLGAIPTVILVLVTFAAYNFLVHRPLNRVLAERRERTAGAVARAQADIAAAEHKTAEYERRLLEARQAIFKVQEARRKKVLKAREAALAEARREADAMMREAGAVLKREINEAKQRLQTEAERLSAAVIRTILRPVTAPVSGGRQ